MLPEYLSYWGFTRSPFSLSPDPGMLFLSSQHREALLRLKYGVLSNKGGALLISDNAGNGKTSILRKLVEDLNVECDGKTKIAFIDHPTLTVNQMIAEIARQLGVARVRKEKIDNLNALRVKLVALHEDGMRTLVIVDEGQMLVHKPDILQELRILLNFCVSEAFLLSFIFSGQKPLEGAVRSMPEFWQRLPVRCFLRNVDLRDTGDLVRHRVRAAGQAERELFTETAVEGIYRYSQGCPRVICAVADLALLVGHSLRSQRIDFIEVSQATSDMTRSGEPFHYFSFGGAPERKKAKRRKCPGCRKFVKAGEGSCPRCGQTLTEPPARPAPPEEVKVQCPGCLQLGPPAARCASCGFVLLQACPRCQQRNPAESMGCVNCGYRLPGRERLASRQFEEGLRRLGIEAIPPQVSQRFPALQEEGRVYMGWVAPRFFWGHKSELQTRGQTIEGSFFVTERSLVFANDSHSRRISYREIRGLSVDLGEKRGRLSRPRLRIVLDEEEVRLAFPVRTDKPVQLVSLISDFVTNKRISTA